MNIKRLITFSLFCISLSVSQGAFSAWYQVEIVVFDNLYADTDGESWYQNPGLPDRSNSIEMIEILEEDELSATLDEENGTPERQVNIPYKKLSDDFHRLDGIQRVLKLSREYRPLLHVAWQQPGLGPRSARSVHIQQFEEPDLQPPDAGDEEAFDIDAMRSEEEALYDDFQVLDLLFDGTIKLRSSRFLHVDIDIAYFPESPDNDESVVSGIAGGLQEADYVRLQESRKIKLNEIHYFDHPLFGLILRVSRLNLN